MAELPPDRLTRRCDPETLGFAATDELIGLGELIGQSRAMDAIRLASSVPHKDFNLFVLGPPGSGRHTSVLGVLREHARGRPVPSDWAYVNNFEEAHKPRALCLPPGTAKTLRLAMEALIDALANEIPTLFESDDYQAKRRAIEQEFGERHESAMSEFAERARAEDVALVTTPMGFMLTAMRDGKPIKSEDFEKLDDAEREAIQAKIARLQEELAAVLREAPKLEQQHRERVEALNASMAERVVSARFAELDAQFTGIEPIRAYLDDVRQDIIANAELFLLSASQPNNSPFPEAVRKFHRSPEFDRYVVNVMVSHNPDNGDGAPVETVELPTFDRLLGRIEHVSQMGSLVTNFTMIKPGALHRANGGYLVLDARRVLSEPFAWDALKQSIRSQAITMTSLGERLSLMSTTSLEPDPIPLSVRVVLVGDPFLHALLVMLDPDFSELFKVQADFEHTIDRNQENLVQFAHLIAAYVTREGLLPMSADGVARVLDEASRAVEDSEKLTLRIGVLGDLVREADHYARSAERQRIERQDIDHAVHEQERRASRIRDHLHEAVVRGTLLIDTAGAAVGVINGLSVIDLGNYRFGRPSRISARVRMGSGKLVDIEREVELGGPLHSKGVMILGGYLTASYALDVPYSLHASLVFEQNYGGVDGDSASCAELCALLSALSNLPIEQGLAVTGSVNQLGQVQAIGGVNAKIEGFFDTCVAQGLTGRQGVLIPASNVEHLMLRDEVVAAVGKGQFRIVAVETVDEVIALLTGTDAGERGDDGRYPDGSVNARVEARLRAFAEYRQSFARSLEDRPPEDART